MKRKFKKSITYIFFLFIITAFSGELALRIYNPFHFRLKGNRVVLLAHENKIYKIKKADGQDSTIVSTRNQLGFRGPEPAPSFKDQYTIIVIGGSATECVLLSDGQDWPNLLYKKLKTDFPALWLNNAGLDGHSTYGHIKLLDQYVLTLKPKMIVFMIGANDVGRTDLSNSEKGSNLREPGLVEKIAEKSYLVNTFLNLYRSKKAKNANLDYTNKINTIVTGKTLGTLEGAQNFKLNMQGGYDSLRKEYKERVQTIITLCRNHQIEPVFITQPSIMGNAVDDVTGFNFSNAKIYTWMTGLQYWELLQRYIKNTIEAAVENNCFYIDAATYFPKNRYMFYDMLHFTNAGSQSFSDSLYEPLKKILQIKIK